MSTRDIARKYNTAQTNVRRLMEYYSIKARKNHERTDYYKEKMKPIYDVYKTDYIIWHSKTCEWCGKEFTVPSSKKNNKFCSKQCLESYKTSGRTNQYCEICGKDIGWKRYKRRFCPDCLSIYKSESQINRIQTQCAYCGNDIMAIPSRYENNEKVYCDAKCMAKHYAQIYTGENSPTWTGGKRHYTGGWFDARDKARERDNYKCAICGITEDEYGQELSVHHIKKYKEFDDKTIANKLDNLISLCEPCHRFVHSKKNVDQVYIEK